MNDLNKLGEALGIRDSRLPIDLGALSRSLDCVKIIDLAGTLQYVNLTGREALGLGTEDVSALQWLALLPPTVRSGGAQAIAALGTGQSQHFTGMSIDRDGDIRHWDNHLIPVQTGDGSFDRVLCISRDVTRETQLQRIVSDGLDRLRSMSAVEEVPTDVGGRRSRQVGFGGVATIPSQISSAPHLTTKELECLHWVVRGKTAHETAIIVGRSRRTVEFHLSNATRKLEAANKFQAAMMAAHLKLI